MKSAIWIVNGILLLGLLAFIGFFAFTSARDNYGTNQPPESNHSKNQSLNSISTSSKISAVGQFLVRAKTALTNLKQENKNLLENPPDYAELLLIQQRIQKLKARRSLKEAEQKNVGPGNDPGTVVRLNKEIADLTQEIVPLELAASQMTELTVKYQDINSQIEKIQSKIKIAEKDLQDLTAQLEKERSGVTPKQTSEK